MARAPAEAVEAMATEVEEKGEERASAAAVNTHREAKAAMAKEEKAKAVESVAKAEMAMGAEAAMEAAEMAAGANTSKCFHCEDLLEHLMKMLLNKSQFLSHTQQSIDCQYY